MPPAASRACRVVRGRRPRTHNLFNRLQMWQYDRNGEGDNVTNILVISSPRKVEMSSWPMESEAVQPQQHSADETAEILDYLWKSQAHAHDVVKYTDTKAGFLSVFTVAIVGIV